MNTPVHAMLFDLDGTLIDTGELHYHATVQTLGTFGRFIDRDEYNQHIHGNNNKDITEYFFPNENEGIRAAYATLKEQSFRSMLSAGETIPPLAGLMNLLDWADAHEIPIGLVTNAPRENKDAMLAALGLTGRFDPVILGDDLPRGKPDPLPFLTALDALGVGPENAIGFDDSAHGIRAVASAGMFAVGVETGLSATALFKNGANIVIDDFTSPELLDVLNTAHSLTSEDHLESKRLRILGEPKVLKS